MIQAKSSTEADVFAKDSVSVEAVDDKSGKSNLYVPLLHVIHNGLDSLEALLGLLHA